MLSLQALISAHLFCVLVPVCFSAQHSQQQSSSYVRFAHRQFLHHVTFAMSTNKRSINAMPRQPEKQLHAKKFSSLLHGDSRLLGNATFSDYELLCRAIELGSQRVVYHLLDKGCCVYKPDSPTLPLHSALQKLSRVSGWTNVVLKLLYAGARVSDEDARGNTALHVGFVKEIHGHVLDFLLRVYVEECGEDAVNADGVSVLHVACTRPKVEFVKRLLEEKADVNRQIPHRPNTNFAGYTPLHFAVHHGNHEVAELLLKRGARIYEHDLNGSTPLHVACYRRDSKMIDLILTHDRITANVVDSNGLSHFMIACTSHEPAFAKEHLRVAECQPWTSAKTLINSCTKNIVDGQFAGYTPLHFAAEFGSAEVFELLLARGARCCAMSGQLFTPLMLAYEHGHEQIVPRVFECRCERDEVVGQDNEDVRGVFEKSVSDGKTVENALVCVDSEESGYVSEKESVEMNVVSEKSVLVGGNNSLGKVVGTAKSLKVCVASCESHTDALNVSSRKRTRKTLCCLACCNSRMTRSKRFRKV